MDAETRAALEWVIPLAEMHRNSDWVAGHIAALKALLSGGGALGHQLAGSSAPDAPDSAAKIADDIHRVIADIRYHLSAPLRDGLDKDLRTIAARVEALGLEPSEREVVRRAEECPDCGGSGFIEGRYGAQGPLTRETCQTCLPDEPAGDAEAERLWNEDKWNEDRLWQEMMASKRREE